MSRYLFIRRLRGPAFLLLVGVNALLAQADILGWSRSWPFYLILAGVLSLAERVALASAGSPAASWRGGWPQQPVAGAGPGAPAPAAPQNAAAPVAGASTALVASRWQEIEKGKEGGQS